MLYVHNVFKAIYKLQWILHLFNFYLLSDFQIDWLHTLTISWNTKVYRKNFMNSVCEFIRGKVDILMISETRIEESFSLGQFKVNGFNAAFRLDCNINSGGIMLFVWEDIPAKLIASKTFPVEDLYVEVKLKSKSGW